MDCNNDSKPDLFAAGGSTPAGLCVTTSETRGDITFAKGNLRGAAGHNASSPMAARNGVLIRATAGQPPLPQHGRRPRIGRHWWLAIMWIARTPMARLRSAMSMNCTALRQSRGRWRRTSRGKLGSPPPVSRYDRMRHPAPLSAPEARKWRPHSLRNGRPSRHLTAPETWFVPTKARQTPSPYSPPSACEDPKGGSRPRRCGHHGTARVRCSSRFAEFATRAGPSPPSPRLSDTPSPVPKRG